MSTLTKIFIVLLFVFSTTFTAMVVATANRTVNWRETSEKYRENAKICETNLRHAHAAGAARLAAARDEVRAFQKTAADLQSKMQTARSDAAQLQTQLAQLNAEIKNTEAVNRGLLGQLQVAEDARNEYRTQRNELESRSIDLERRNVDLNDRVNELTARVAVLAEQQRQYEQQLNILKQENERLSMSARIGGEAVALEAPAGVATPGVRADTPVIRSAIRGRILNVSDDLITISVGGADGVRKDMVFVIHRDGRYVGDVKINLVDPTQSAGRLIRKSDTPARDDLVTDAVAMSGPGN